MERQEELAGDLTLRKSLFQQAQNAEFAVGQLTPVLATPRRGRQGPGYLREQVADYPGASALGQQVPGLVDQVPRPLRVTQLPSYRSAHQPGMPGQQRGPVGELADAPAEQLIALFEAA